MSLKNIRELITKYENYADSLDENLSIGMNEVDLVNEIINDLYSLEEKTEKIKGCPKVLDNSPETKAYLDKLKKIYLIGCWAHYGVLEFPFSGKYVDKDKTKPLVYQYDDHNGTCDNWYLREIDDTTTGHIWGWTFNKKEAERIADNLEKEKES